MKQSTAYFLLMLVAPSIVFATTGVTRAGEVVSSGLSSAAQSVAGTSGANACSHGPDLSKLARLCSVVFDRTRAAPASGYRFEYERLVSEAACVSPTDDEPAKISKIQSLWRNNQSAFKCNSTDFDVSDGSILKYSVSSRSFNFINTAISKWKLDLNFHDRDGQTVYDYVQGQIDRNRGSSIESVLKDYLQKIEDGGGKPRTGLP